MYYATAIREGAQCDFLEEVQVWLDECDFCIIEREEAEDAARALMDVDCIEIGDEGIFEQ